MPDLTNWPVGQDAAKSHRDAGIHNLGIQATDKHGGELDFFGRMYERACTG